MRHLVVWLRGAICYYRDYTFCIATAFGTAALNYEFRVVVKLGLSQWGKNIGRWQIGILTTELPPRVQLGLEQAGPWCAAI
jgi:hypothetical protein